MSVEIYPYDPNRTEVEAPRLSGLCESLRPRPTTNDRLGAQRFRARLTMTVLLPTTNTIVSAKRDDSNSHVLVSCNHNMSNASPHQCLWTLDENML